MFNKLFLKLAFCIFFFFIAMTLVKYFLIRFVMHYINPCTDINSFIITLFCVSVCLGFLLILFTCFLTLKFIEKDARERYASQICHDLRTPLTSIIGAITIISNNLVGKIPSSMEEMMNVLALNSKKLSETVNELTSSKKFEEIQNNKDENE